MTVIITKRQGGSIGIESAKQTFTAEDSQSKFIVTDFVLNGNETVLSDGVGVLESLFTFDFDDNSVNFIVGQERAEFSEIKILR